jgi:hypothetical protein
MSSSALRGGSYPKIGRDNGGLLILIVWEYEGYPDPKCSVSASITELRMAAADMGRCGCGSSQKTSSSLRWKPYCVSGAGCFLLPISIV